MKSALAKIGHAAGNYHVGDGGEFESIVTNEGQVARQRDILQCRTIGECGSLIVVTLFGIVRLVSARHIKKLPARS